MENYSILRSTEGGYTINDVQDICRRHGVEFIGHGESGYIGHKLYEVLVPGDMAHEAKMAFEDELFRYG